MKNFTLLVTLLLTVVTGFAQQNWGGTPPNCELPAGFTLGQGARMETYNNPLKNCAKDCGIITPGVGGNDPANVIFPPKASNGVSQTVCFQFFVFDANMRCESDKDIKCSTFVTLYIVESSYDRASQPPSASQSFGKSQRYLLKSHGDVNCLTVNYDQGADPNKQYRVFMDFEKGSECIQQNTKYIIDILPEGGPQPVNLSSFLAGRSGSNVSLNWKTEIEMNAINFEVQRSFDNVNFQTIETVTSAVNGSSTKSYSYVDKNNTSKTLSFCTLKMVKQAEVVYSDIKTVKGIAAKLDFTIFPNPSVGNAKITISDLSEPTRVQLLDNSGRLVKTLMLNNTNTVELNGLLKGAYMVRIIGSVSGNTEVRKLTVIN